MHSCRLTVCVLFGHSNGLRREQGVMGTCWRRRERERKTEEKRERSGDRMKYATKKERGGQKERALLKEGQRE